MMQYTATVTGVYILHHPFTCLSYRNRDVYCIILLFVLATVIGVYTA
jgi:hypothetical protein